MSVEQVLRALKIYSIREINYQNHFKHRLQYTKKISQIHHFELCLPFSSNQNSISPLNHHNFRRNFKRDLKKPLFTPTSNQIKKKKKKERKKIKKTKISSLFNESFVVVARIYHGTRDGGERRHQHCILRRDIRNLRRVWPPVVRCFGLILLLFLRVN